MVKNSSRVKSMSMAKKLGLYNEFDSCTLSESISQLSKNSIILPKNKEIKSTTSIVAGRDVFDIADALPSKRIVDSNFIFRSDNFHSSKFYNFFTVYYFTIFRKIYNLKLNNYPNLFTLIKLSFFLDSILWVELDIDFFIVLNFHF